MCTVAMNSPVFSPTSRVSSSLFCKTHACSSPDKSFSSSVQSPSSSPSPFKRRISGLIKACNDEAVSNLSSSASSSPATLLKRKRPGRLDIPVAALSFCGDVEERRREVVEVVEDEGYGYSVYCKRGRREAMEDRFKAMVNLQGNSKQAFFGVFDGHGGAQAAEYASENLAKNIAVKLDRTESTDEIEEAVKQGYLQTDTEFLNQGTRGGSCCATAIIKEGKLIVSNAGDCRAVASRGGAAVALTSDHRPSREDEKRRIESLGGYVDFHRGVWRVLGSLAVSRGIGDRSLKQWVIAEPETRVVDLVPELEFLIIGSDGLWDKVSNQEAVDIARPLCVGIERPEQEQPLVACEKLVPCVGTSSFLDQYDRFRSILGSKYFVNFFNGLTVSIVVAIFAYLTFNSSCDVSSGTECSRSR